MQDLFLVGAGTGAYEILEFAIALSDTTDPPWRVRGLIDDDPAKVGMSIFGYPILSTLDDWKPSQDDRALCTIGSPQVRALIHERLQQRSVRLTSLIHPLSYVAPSATIGEGSVVYPLAQISSSARVGRNVLVNFAASIGHHASIGDSTVVSAHVDVTGSVEVGERVLLGSHSTVAPSRKIGDDAIVALGSAVVADVASNKRVLGVPAREYKL